ncbi:tetraspanin-8-like [Symphorus nematophorus]
MAKINGCLKCLFIFFNVVFAIFGCLLVFGAVKSSVYSGVVSGVGGPNLGWGWVFALGVLGISCLGIFAGCSEKELALKIFAGFMAVGMLIMLICGIVVVVKRNQIRTAFDEASAEVAKPFVEDEGMRAVLEGLQLTSRCCGVVSASDWGNNIPDSCECTGGREYGALGTGRDCTSKPVGATGPDRIYKQTCSDIIFMYFDIFFKIIMAFFFGFAVTALLGLLVSILMIHQVRRSDNAGGPSIAMKGY